MNHQKLKSVSPMSGDECVNPEKGGGAGYVKAKASTSSKRRSCCPSAIKCPAILTGVGCCFALLGLIPFLITMATHKNSATLIGLGFMGFGALLLVPGLCWCAVVYAQRRVYRPWKKGHFRRHSQEETPALSSQHDDQHA